VRLVVIHRRFIARCYRIGHPAANPDRLHNSVTVAGFYLGPSSALKLVTT
jgi:hypothetical protein